MMAAFSRMIFTTINVHILTIVSKKRKAIPNCNGNLSFCQLADAANRKELQN